MKPQKKQGKRARKLSPEEVSILRAKPGRERNRAKVSWPDQKLDVRFEEDMAGDSEVVSS